MSTTETTIVPLELRRAGQDGHILTGLVVPYNRVSYKTEHKRGERFAPGAFASAVTGGVGQVRLTDYHLPGQQRRPVGVATEFRDDAQGLLGSFRFYETPEGRGAFENVIEDTYGGLSVGFAPRDAGPGVDGVREVRSARLYHVSLVDEPAYEEARILAVRAAVEGGAGSGLLTADELRLLEGLSERLGTLAPSTQPPPVVPAVVEQTPSERVLSDEDREIAALVAREWDAGVFRESRDVVTLGIEYGSRSGNHSD